MTFLSEVGAGMNLTAPSFCTLARSQTQRMGNSFAELVRLGCLNSAPANCLHFVTKVACGRVPMFQSRSSMMSKVSCVVRVLLESRVNQFFVSPRADSSQIPTLLCIHRPQGWWWNFCHEKALVRDGRKDICSQARRNLKELPRRGSHWTQSLKD